MSIIFGTSDGVWRLDNGSGERIGLAGKSVCHVADSGTSVLAAVPRDGLYDLSGSGERRIWEGDARACAVGPDNKLYVGMEPAMVFRSDDAGQTWKRSDKIDELPTRSEWYFPPPPHQAPTSVPSIFFRMLPAACSLESRSVVSFFLTITAAAGER